MKILKPHKLQNTLFIFSAGFLCFYLRKISYRADLIDNSEMSITMTY
jgi:hypothetical protein